MADEITANEVEIGLRKICDGDPKPSPERVQIILDRIERVEDERRRTILYTVAKQNLTGVLRDLVVASRARANRLHGVEIRKVLPSD